MIDTSAPPIGHDDPNRSRTVRRCRKCGQRFHPWYDSPGNYCGMPCVWDRNRKPSTEPLTPEWLAMLLTILADCDAALEANRQYAAQRAAQNMKENSDER